MQVRWGLGIVVALLLASVAFSSASAGTDALRNKTQKLNISLKQATLLEGMAQTACFVMSGVDRNQVRTEALEYVDGFDTALTGLRAGHEWLGLLPEQNPDALAQLAQADAQWHGFKPVIQQIVYGDYHSVVVQQLLTGSAPARLQASALSAQMIAVYGGALSEAERVGLVEASAHRMRTQRALTQLCFFLNKIGGAETKRSLQATLAEIEAGFTHLSDGTGPLLEAPNGRVKRNLRTAALFWKKISAEIETALASGSADPAVIRKALKLNKSVLKQLNQAVEAYLPTQS